MLIVIIKIASLLFKDIQNNNNENNNGNSEGGHLIIGSFFKKHSFAFILLLIILFGFFLFLIITAIQILSSCKGDLQKVNEVFLIISIINILTFFITPISLSIDLTFFEVNFYHYINKLIQKNGYREEDINSIDIV